MSRICSFISYLGYPNASVNGEPALCNTYTNVFIHRPKPDYVPNVSDVFISWKYILSSKMVGKQLTFLSLLSLTSSSLLAK